ncbi:alpha/beta hydrolase [Neorhizobium galegae]|uniref:alpha/beta fold hydrolase n=2 Tax=Neorhizobium galegae TaxID=399 RepID=UPI0021044AFF|nr:alpha/beta hydrolase [Neorhizobium galegae]MCQ1774447.1 alpha/beta hydrolase [Neorhizobium galegae]
MSNRDVVGDSVFYPGWRPLQMEADGVQFSGVVGGSGPPVLLLHGFPETHIAWRRMAPALSRDYSLVIPDLPGYGRSTILARSERFTKRRVARAVSSLMTALGHETFGVVGHDRGARVGYRLALDHPDRVRAFASLTVVPTLDAMSSVDHEFALKNFHWFLFAQPDDLAEHLLDLDPPGYLERVLARMTERRDFLEQEVTDAYHEAFGRRSVRHAIVEDYRSALREDLEHDRADRREGRKLRCPVLVSWPKGNRQSDDTSPIEVWRQWADDVIGGATSGGHLQPEDAPEEVLAMLTPFLSKSFSA